MGYNFPDKADSFQRQTVAIDPLNVTVLARILALSSSRSLNT
ncbi:hypothetical protein [Dechloromonas hankyongensis]|nr:hypothetical protein [Dechloromonas hankyongensis]